MKRLGLVLVLATLPAAAPAADSYSIRDLGGEDVAVKAIADDGASWVGCVADEQAGTFRPALWTDAEGSETVTNLAGSDVGCAEGLSGDATQIVGWTDSFQAASWGDGTVSEPTDLGTVPSKALDVNGSGTAVGWKGTSRRAILWTSEGSEVDLGALVEGTSEAAAINDAGTIVVGWRLNGSAFQAVQWTSGEGGWTATDLAGLGGSGSQARDVNESGAVAGWARDESGNKRAVLWQSGTPTDLGTLGGSESEAAAVNDSGEVVGWSDVEGSDTTHGFLWNGSTLEDLNGKTGASDWTVTEAWVIGDGGEIIGKALWTGQVTAAGESATSVDLELTRTVLLAPGAGAAAPPEAPMTIAAVDPATLTNDTNKPENLELPFGLFDIEVDVPVGGTAMITLKLPQAVAEGTVWYKYDDTTGWSEFSGAQFNSTRDEVTLTLVDGGAGDQDGVADGRIRDPSGPGRVAASTSTSSSGGGGGGCFLQALTR
ncbi:MAG: hypothetical protein Kow0092_35210 [Deferrisomatales bacterium]